MEFYADGKVLGRNAASWARITGFYFIYYSLLGGLIYFTVNKYAENLDQPGGKTQKIITRLDQPGSAVYPFQAIASKFDVDGELHLSSKSMTSDANSQYIDRMTEFIESYTNNGGSAVNCHGNDKVLESTCRVPNAKFYAEQVNLVNAIKNKEPIVTVTMNKNYNWIPHNVNGLPDYSQKFVKDSIQMKCFESGSDGRPVVDSKFKIELLGLEKAIYPSYFPYTANDKHANEADQIAYNKPFLIAQIKAADDVDINEAWKLETDQKMKYFRCEMIADNVQRPLVGDDFYGATSAVKAWSNDLEKLGLGYVQFAFSYLD